MDIAKAGFRPSADEPSAFEVRSALERLLASPDFDATAKRRAFLQFIVEETLEGRASGLKGFTVASAVFGRDETFDPKTDPVVRFEARRLRRDLDSYYVGPGAADPIRISMPKGGYAAHFEFRAGHGDRIAGSPSQDAVPRDPPKDSDPPPLPPLRAAWQGRAAAFALAAAVLAALGILLWRGIEPADNTTVVATGGEPKIIVESFVPLDRSEMSASLAIGLPSEVFIDLSRFQQFRLYMPLESTDPASQASAYPIDSGTFVVRGNVYTDVSTADVQVHLLSAQSGEILWSETYSGSTDAQNFLDFRRDIAAAIATVLGQPYGPIGAALQAESYTGEAASTDSYLCVMRAYGYRRSFTADEFTPTLACLEAAVERDPTYADAWAMLGWLYMDAGRLGFRDEAPETLYRRGAEAAERALELEPNSLLGLKALSAIRHYMGDYAVSQELARRAVALNPNDPETLAQLGWRLAIRGEFDEGIPLLNAAIERSVDPPGWYFRLLIFDAYFAGDPERMLALAERAIKDGTVASYAYMVLAAVEAGDMERAASAALRVPEDSAFRQDAKSHLRLHGATEEIAERMSAGLDEAFARVAADAVR